MDHDDYQLFVLPSINIRFVLGPLKPEYTVKYGAVSVIFLLSGFTLNTEALHKVFKQYRLHSFIQIFTFVVIPLLVQFIATFLWYIGVNVWILRG